MCGGANGQTDIGGAETILGGILTATGYGAGVGIPMMLGGAGTVASGVATADQLKQQNDIAAAGIIQQGMLQKRGESDVGNLVSSKIAQSTATAQQKTAQQLAAYRSALTQSSAIDSSASPNVPGASKAYKAEQGTASTTANTYVNALANSAAVTQGTQLERVGEGEDIASTAGQLGLLSTQSNEQNYVTQLQMKATQANPWLNSLGMLLKGAGAAYGAVGGLASGAATVGSQAADTANALGDGTTGLGLAGNTVANYNSALNLGGSIPSTMGSSMVGAFGTGAGGAVP